MIPRYKQAHLFPWHTHTHTLTFKGTRFCQTGTKVACWAEWFSWELQPVCFWLGVKQIILCMHEYITSAAVIVPGMATAFGTRALVPLLASVFLLSLLHHKMAVSVSCEHFYWEEMPLHLQGLIDVASWGGRFLHDETFTKLRVAGAGFPKHWRSLL